MWKKLKRAAKKVVKAVKKVVRVIKEVCNRTAGILDFLASLVGIRPRKYLRVQVMVLADSKGPVVPLATVQRWWDEALRVFLDRANVEIRKIHFLPVESMTVGDRTDVFVSPACSFSEGFSDAADYYEDKAAEIRGGFQQTPLAAWVADNIGIGEELVAFAIRDIGDAAGCSYPYNFYMLLAAVPPPPKLPPKTTTLAHEIAHMCGLWHTSTPGNLMNGDRSDMASDLSRLQISVLRNSRFVTYVKRTS